MAVPPRYRPTATPDAHRSMHARIGVFVLFLSMGVLLATFLSRFPTLLIDFDVDKDVFSILLISGAGGAIVALLLTGWMAARFGTRFVLVWSTVAHAVSFLVVAYSSHLGSRPLFVVGQFLVAFSFSFTNVAMNAEAAAIERHLNRKIMPQFHAAFSVGMAVGLVIGYFFSRFEVSAFRHYAIVVLAFTVIRLAVVPMAVIDGRPTETKAGGLGGPFATARAEYRDSRVLMIGAIVFAAAVSENAAMQWVTISGDEDFNKSESVGVVMYWVFVVSMVIVRSLGGRLLERFGRVVMLRASALVTIAGIIIFAFTPVFWLAFVALVFWGVGAALGIPISFSAAADDPKRAPARVAAVSSFATVAGVAIPPLIGSLAEAITTRRALLVVIVGSLVIITLAKAVRRDQRMFPRIRRRLGRLRPEESEVVVSVAPTDTGTTLV